jgi:hypothetical protein
MTLRTGRTGHDFPASNDEGGIVSRFRSLGCFPYAQFRHITTEAASDRYVLVGCVFQQGADRTAMSILACSAGS